MDQCPASIWQAVKVLRASESSSLARGNKAAAARLPGNPPACGDDDEDAPGDLTFEDPGGMDGTEGDAVLMLMLMCMDLGVLQEQVPAGARLVKMLDDSLHVLSDDHARRQLVSETRKFLLGSDAAFWKDAARHVSSVSQKLFDMPRGKKDEVMRKFSQHPARKSRPLSCMPSLLQIVYGTGSRSHVMLDSWMDSLCIMQGKLKGVPPPRGVVQFIEVPNLMQRVMKVYVDWDLLLSTVERSGFFADHCHLGLDSPEAQVEYLRNLALRTPAVMCTILRDAGLLSAQQDAQVGTRALGGESVFVLVKEGTRKAACHVSPAASAGAAACGASAASAPVQALQFPRLDGGKTNGRVDAGISSHQANHGSDWKISFHFIFQILVSQSQFEAVYNLVTSKVASESADLAMVLNCVSIRGWESSSAMKLGHSTHSLQDAQAAAMGSVLRRYAASGGGSAPAAGTSAGDADCMAALIGLDLHPKQNAHQGLACLGSRKPAPTSQVSAAAAAAAAAPSSKLLGMIRVELGSPSDKQRERRRLCAWEWVEGYASSAHPLLVLAESSILAPGPRCVGLCSDGCNAVGGSERYPGCTPIPAAFALAPSAPSGASKRKRLLHPDVAVAPASKGHRNIRPCAGLGSGSDDAEPSSRRPVFSRCGGGEGVTSAAAKSLSPPMLAARSNSTSPPPSYHPLPALGGTMAAGRVRSSPAPITSCSQQPLGSLCLSPLASGSLLSRQGLSNHARRVVSREDVMNSMPLWFKMQVGRLRASLGGFSPACQTSLRSSPTQPSPPFAGGSHGSKVGVDGSSLAEVFRTMRTDMQSLSVPMQVSKLSSKCFFAQVYQTEICMCTLSMMQVPFKEYKCHKSNGVVFCFCGDRVLVTCLDNECKYALERNRYSYHLMSRVIEDDIFGNAGCSGSSHSHASGAGNSASQQGAALSMHHRPPLSPSSTSSSSSLVGSGLDPGMLQDNPARRRLKVGGGLGEKTLLSIVQPSSGSASHHRHHAARDPRYTMHAGHVRRTLSHEQYSFLQGLSREKELIAKDRESRAGASSSPDAVPGQQAGGAKPSRINIRDFCKVPYSNMMVSMNNKITWMELTEPMLKSFVTWSRQCRTPVHGNGSLPAS